MSAQGWSVKGLDPKIREAAREAAARAGMSLGEYLSAALQGQTTPAVARREPAMRPRAARLQPAYDLDSELDQDEWRAPDALSRAPESAHLAQRLESIERRTQLAIAGLDRAVTTIDRSVLGLAARLEDAERVSSESAERMAVALEQFRQAGETLGGRLEHAEYEASESRAALDHAHSDLAQTRDRLENQVAAASEIARRAEAAASFLASELEHRDASFSGKVDAIEEQSRAALAQARAAAEQAAHYASEASIEAVEELRRLQESLSDRLTETEGSARRAVETAIAQSRADAEEIKAALAHDVARLEGEIEARLAAATTLRQEQGDLIARIERVETSARESTAGLRQAAGAAIADLRNAQLMLSARVKQVEAAAGQAGGADLSDIRGQQAEIAARLAALEEQSRANPVGDALAAFEQRLADIDARVAADKFAQVDGAVRTLDGALNRLAERIAETESTANSAIRTLEETVSSLGAKVEAGGAAKETEALRQLLEQRLDTMAQSVTEMVGQARDELAGQVSAVLDGVQGGELEGALADVNRRLASAERRQAQTIEAISIEIKRMSETVDRRLRAVEARNDDAAGASVREELNKMAETLERRFDEIERREAAAFDRMGLEVGRLSERLEERVGAVESRSAQAIEQVGEQVARMGERFNHRQETLARELNDRMIDSEERSNSRVADAINSIMRRLAEVEEQSAEQIEPVKKAMSNVAARLEAFESGEGEALPTPTRRLSDYGAFDPEPYVSPMEAARPVRAAPLPPLTPVVETHPGPSVFDDIYVAEDTLEQTEPTDDNSADIEPPPIECADEFLDDADVFAGPETAADGEASDAPELLWSPLEEPFQADEIAPTEAFPFASEDVGDFAPELVADTDMGAEVLAEAPASNDPPPPPGRNDYLAAARRAAQAQAVAKAKPAKRERAREDAGASLRGSSRIVLWGAASIMALAIAGGAYYLNMRHAAERAGEPRPEPEPAPAQQAAAPVDDAAYAAAAAGAEPIAAGPLAQPNVSLEQAAQTGDVVAQYELGLQRLAAGEHDEAVALLRQAANRNLAMAQYRLAKLYERGEGVAVDLVQARQWTERAAAAGNRRAMHDLGVYFARGEGAPLDEAAAFRWFRQAAELGVADSQYNLGVLYQQGRGVGASGSEALFWFLVASRQGDADATTRAEALQAQLPAVQVEQARARAQAFRPRAASAQANGEFGPRVWAAPSA